MDINGIELRLTEITDLADDLKDVVPYVRMAAAAYTLVRKQRIIRFLKSIHTKSNAWDAGKKKKFEKYIQSDVGTEILSDYADSVLLTNATLAHACLALLYSDFEGHQYTQSLKLHAVSALRGCSNQSLLVFVHLLSMDLSPQNDPPYEVRLITDGILTREPHLGAFVGDETELLTVVDDLSRRGLFLPDHAGARAGATKPHWFYPLGVSSLTVEYLALIGQAETLLTDSPDLT